jgi:hypothetical protein
MSIKYLISGLERSGKTTATSKIEDALIVSIDMKKYPFKKPHVNIKEYEGMNNFIDRINETIVKYKEKFGEFPKSIVFDTVTSLYTLITKYSMDKFNGFNIHSNISKETLMFNDYVENTLLENGVNVVIIAHAVWDQDTGRYYIPATGAFAKSGSWLGAVDEASFIEFKNNKYSIYHNDGKFPCRTTLDIKVKESIEEWDINEHIEKLKNSHNDNEEYEM